MKQSTQQRVGKKQGDKPRKCKHEWRQMIEYWKIPTPNHWSGSPIYQDKFYCIKCLKIKTI